MRPRRVIVAGAGPVGLVTALRLARAGIEVVVLEAEPRLTEELRGSTFHPPTLDMLDEFGVVEDMIAQGRITPTWQVRMHETGERAQFDLSILAGHTSHPYRLQCEQWKLARLLLEKLQSVQFNSRVVELSQNEERICVTVDRAGERSVLEADYLVGADGARSTVRKAIGLEFKGETFPETTLLATTDFEFRDHLEGLSGVNYCWSRHGTFSLLRLPGEWRVSLYPDEGENVDDALSDEAIEAKLQRIVRHESRYVVKQKRPYRIHQRVVERYRVGRAVLAGDSAHVNSPSGGMGMNGGIHDAFNLSGKLIRIIRGEDEGLLDLYERQRRPIALEHVIAQSGRNRARMQERDPEKRRAMLRELQAIASDRGRALEHLLRTSMIEGLRQAEAIH